jgi:hypothetical protein
MNRYINLRKHLQKFSFGKTQQKQKKAEKSRKIGITFHKHTFALSKAPQP